MGAETSCWCVDEVPKSGQLVPMKLVLLRRFLHSR